MYYCPDCGLEFSNAKFFSETHSLSHPPFEKIKFCPNCLGERIREKVTTHCRCCGSRLPEKFKDYCSAACAKKGERLWKKEKAKRIKEFKNPLNVIVREVEIYNKKNKTNISYGQYVALIRSKKKGNKK